MQLGSLRCNTSFGSLILDPAERTASVGLRKVFLSAAELAIVSLLMARQDVPMSREAIVEALSATGLSVLPRMVDVHICRLRHKLSVFDLGGLVSTAWGRGYVIESGPREEDAPLTPTGGHSIAALLSA